MMEAQYNALDALQEVDVLRLIGAELSEDEDALLPVTREQLVEVAKNWLAERRAVFQRAVCREEIYELLNARSDRKTLVLAVAELISGVCLGVTPDHV